VLTFSTRFQIARGTAAPNALLSRPRPCLFRALVSLGPVLSTVAEGLDISADIRVALYHFIRRDAVLKRMLPRAMGGF
jgi:hypothetical protein